MNLCSCSLSRLFLPTYFVKEIKFHSRLFTSSLQRKSRQFHDIVGQKRLRNVQKMCCKCKVVILLTKPIVFLLLFFFFYFFVADASLDLKVPGKDVQESDQYIYLVVRALCTRKRFVCFEKID